jgi:hypothetical protein
MRRLLLVTSFALFIPTATAAAALPHAEAPPPRKLAVTVPSKNVTAGQPVTLTVTAVGARNATDADYEGTVAITSSDAHAQLPADVTFTAGDAGRVEIPGVVLETAGSESVSVADVSTGTPSGKAKLKVRAGEPVALSVSAPASATAGVAFAVAASTVDQFGNTIRKVTSKTQFGLSGGQCTKHTCSSTVAGPATVGATDGALSGQQGLSVAPGPLAHLVISPSSSTIAAISDPDRLTAINANFAPTEPTSQSYSAEGVDAYGNSLGDYTQQTTFTEDETPCEGQTCTSTQAGSALAIKGEAGGAQGAATLNIDPNSVGWRMSCQGDNYDVDGSTANGCEVAPKPANNGVQSNAESVGALPCTDSNSNPNISGTFASDLRTHEEPAVVGFDATTGSTPRWFSIDATGGTFCVNEVVLTLKVTESSHPACYRLTVTTDKSQFAAQTNSSGIAEIDQTSGEPYTDGSTIYVEVSRTCSTGVGAETMRYAVTGHL